jgi:ribosomal protein L14
MIHKGTYLNVSDNCGSKLVRCIEIVKSKQKFGSRGDKILIAVRKLRAHKRISIRVKKGDVYNALILRTKIFQSNNFIDIGLSAFLENSILILNKQFKLIGSRVLGPISKQFRKTKYSRNILLSSGLV